MQTKIPVTDNPNIALKQVYSAPCITSQSGVESNTYLIPEIKWQWRSCKINIDKIDFVLTALINFVKYFIREIESLQNILHLYIKDDNFVIWITNLMDLKTTKYAKNYEIHWII